MIAIDTNLLVRFLVRDDEKQARQARRLIEQNTIFLAKTVLLETEWVLRYTYAFDRPAVADALGKVCGLSQIQVEDAFSIQRALTWHQQGFDFADALHLAASQQADTFYSFDRQLIKMAKGAKTTPVAKP